LLIGPLLARFGEAEIGTPGGCHIGKRPMDAHFDAFRDLGCEVEYRKDKDTYRIVKTKKHHKESVVLKEFSVTATENLMMFGSLSPSLTIEIAAAEPHIQDLGRFIGKLGAKIEGLGSHTIKIKRGVTKSGKEIKHTVVNDYIEAGTFMVLAAATRSNILVKGAPIDDLVLTIQKLREFGVIMDIKSSDVMIWGVNPNSKRHKKLWFSHILDFRQICKPHLEF